MPSGVRRKASTSVSAGVTETPATDCVELMPHPRSNVRAGYIERRVGAAGRANVSVCKGAALDGPLAADVACIVDGVAPGVPRRARRVDVGNGSVGLSEKGVNRLIRREIVSDNFARSVDSGGEGADGSWRIEYCDLRMRGQKSE